MDEYEENAQRAELGRQNALRIQEKRAAIARSLLAPPGPAELVRKNAQALLDAARERREAGGAAGPMNGE